MFRCTQVLVLVVLVAIAPLEASASSGARRMSVPAEEVALSQPASFASNWFHTMMPAIGNGTLLDLCLPGTHDSMTWVVCCIARRWCGCGLMVAHLVIRYDLSIQPSQVEGHSLNHRRLSTKYVHACVFSYCPHCSFVLNRLRCVCLYAFFLPACTLVFSS